jgi:hypothetical protein
MNSSIEAGFASVWRTCAKTVALAGLGFAAGLASTPAQAQYYERPNRFYDEDYGIPGPEVISPERAAIPLAALRELVAQRRLHLIATPRRKGRIYLAEAEDAHGLRHRLVFDVYEGRLLEDTVLGPKAPLPNPSHTTLPKPPQRLQTDEPSKAVLEPAKDKDKDKDQVKVDKPATDPETLSPPPAPQAK